MKNRYPGTCCYCHGHVGEGEGCCEKRPGDRRWRVYHLACRDRSEARGAVRDANCRTFQAECRDRKAEHAAPKVKDDRPGAPNPFSADSAANFLLDREYQMCAEEELTSYGYGLDELFELAKAAAVKGGCPAAMGAPESECYRWNLSEGTCETCMALGLGNPGPAVALHLVEAL